MTTLLASKAAAPWLLRPATAEGVVDNGYATPAMAAVLTGRTVVRAETAPAPKPEVTAATGALAVTAQTEPDTTAAIEAYGAQASGDAAADEMWLAFMEAPDMPRPKKREAPKERVFNPTFSEYTQDFTHAGVDTRYYTDFLYASWIVQN